MSWASWKVPALAAALMVFTAAAPVEAACLPCAEPVEYITWQTDAYGRAVPVFVSAPMEGTFVYRTAFADGRLLPDPIMTAVANSHPCGQILSADCGRCYWRIKLCDGGQEFLMNVDHDGRVLKDTLR